MEKGGGGPANSQDVIRDTDTEGRRSSKMVKGKAKKKGSSFTACGCSCNCGSRNSDILCKYCRVCLRYALFVGRDDNGDDDDDESPTTGRP